MDTKDLGSLLQSLKGRDGVLHIGPSPLMETVASWQADIILAKGRIATCHVRKKGDDLILLSGSQAITWLMGLRRLSWRFEVPSQALQLFSGPLTLPVRDVKERELAVPKRAGKVEPTTILSWPRQWRQVFALVDGSRSVKNIATMLHHPSDVVDKILNELQSIGVIQR